MYGLPDDVDLTFLAGRSLEGVRFSLHRIQLDFDGNVWIEVEGDLSLNGRMVREEPGALRELLEHAVEAVSREGDGDLVLKFGSNSLRVLDSNSAYESYTIGRAGSQIVV
jgi:hypothetical protein